MPKSPNCPNYYILGVSGTHDQPGDSATTAQGSCHGVFVQGLFGFWNLGLLGGAFMIRTGFGRYYCMINRGVIRACQ